MLEISQLKLTKADLNVLAQAAIVLAQSGRITLQQLANALDKMNQYEEDSADGV